MRPAIWLRAVRARFLAASAIAVGVGLAASLSRGDPPDLAAAGLTLAGVLALHASVDLLNDYWDHRRGIDAQTTKTPFSGGTGVIGEGLLSPGAVRTAGIIMMLAGIGIGVYFVILHGPVIALILGFAVASVCLYSTRIVDSGLAEVFVAAKGALITVGTSFIQSGELSGTAAAAGACVGILSALVLFVTSFPDCEADRRGGRRTLVVAVGPRAAASAFWAFPASFAGVLIASIILGILPPHCAVALAALPLAASSGRILRRGHSEISQLVPAMRRAVLFGRIAGVLVLAGLLASFALAPRYMAPPGTPSL